MAPSERPSACVDMEQLVSEACLVQSGESKTDKLAGITRKLWDGEYQESGGLILGTLC